MVEIGQLVIKTAGRDGGEIGIVVDIIDHNYVLVDGNLRRKKCNIKHLEFLDKVVKIKKKAATEDVNKELEKLEIALKKKGKRREAKPRPRKQRKQNSQKKKEIKTKTHSKK
ncbi:50S ribosomal protein L14e [Candidatus Woesearchaeota archaeon]|nr:50S ribosomal protein L14e [Candidatus Woesearchaeota archaeon]